MHPALLYVMMLICNHYRAYNALHRGARASLRRFLFGKSIFTRFIFAWPPQDRRIRDVPPSDVRNRLPRFRFVLYKDLMPRTEALYIVADRPAEVLSVPGVATPPARRRLLPRPAYLSANATYKHQFNVWNLSKWISPGSCRPRTIIFLPAANAILMWNIAVLLRGHVRSIR